ncbi:Rib/alpha-like domain-containing protein [Corynebacterium pygosceleis]|uniref:Rib/alpha-like domain-containing protein n=1 Tax=Corynebacterium pygosceleis TaxID=2800406 RepID=A0A9Q4GJ61_9CORY|nr:Rib/alpha-like domain-containing protein [Corynebacterium pygosceleis]MCK7637056.1 YPDG domain-containing protein [Corynebacterium pygosceleis]MCL0120172.1 YPDG domain-containing protein [Corynebacterium pygosceleis]MCX7467809.1 Rib/alpha-like domain-containing protein [Corynebacterium pygosceleis]
MSRAGVAAIACLSLTLSPLSPVGVALADATYTKGVEATDGAEQVYAADTDALHWGVNEMFRGKATSFEAADGARYDVEAKQFVFPYVSKDDGAKTVSYTGSVTILGECEDATDPSRGTCKVDVTLTDPVVTVDADGTSSVSATVHSTRDGAEWFGPETVELATLDFSGARFNNSDTDTTWVDVAATATDAAADNAFLGTGALENVEFTYPGKTEEKQSTELKLEKYSTAETDLKIDDPMSMIQFDDGSVLQVTDHYGTANGALFNPEHSEVVAVNGLGVHIVADTATRTLYWVDENNAVQSGVLGADGTITAMTKVADLGDTGHVTGFARQADGTLGAVLIPTYQSEPTYARIVEVTPAGEKTVTELPSAKTLHPEIDDSTGYYTDEAYGLSFGVHDGLAALPDGTWVFNYDYEISGKGATPIHITPKEDVKASLFTGAESLFSEYQVVRGVYTNGDIVAFYNGRRESDEKKHTVVGFYRYADGELTPIYTNTAAADFEVVSGVAADADSLYVLSSANKTLNRLSIADGTVQDSVVLDESTELYKYGSSNFNNLISAGNKLIVTVPKDGDGWGDNHTRLATVTPAMSGMTADPSVERVTVGDYDDETSYEPMADATAVEATVGTAAVAPAPTFDMVATDATETDAAPSGATFSIPEAVEGATVGDDGAVTLTAVDAQAGTDVPVTVLVTYADQTTDEYTVTFKVTAAADPTADTGKVFYGRDALTVTAGETGTATPTFVTDDGNKDVPTATFVFEGDVPAGATINENTGVVTYAPTEATDEVENVKIRVTFEDTSTQLTGVSLKAEAATPTYTEQVWYPDSVTVAPGETATSTPKLGGIEAGSEKKDIPADFSFELIEDIAGVSIDATTGTITYVAPADAAEQTIYPRVKVTFPSGKTQQTAPVITVKKDEPAQSDIYVYYGGTVTVDPGQEAVATPEAAIPTPTYTVVDMPAGTTFKFVDNDDEARPAGMTLDENTGVVTFTPTEDQAGQSYFFYVQATYGDGTTAPRPAVGLIKVNEAATPDPDDSSMYNLFYPNTDVTAGESATSAPFADMAGTDDIENGDIPAGTVFELPSAGNPEGAVIDSGTGVITYTPSADMETENVAFSVNATYADGSTDTAIAVFVVSAAAQEIDDNAKYTPVYANGEVKAGGSAAVTPTFDMSDTDTVETGTAPDGTTFAFAGTPDDGFSIDSVTGEVTYEAAEDAEDATVQAMVTVTYADGTGDDATVTFAVKGAEDKTPAPGSSSIVDTFTGSAAGGSAATGIMGLLSVGALFGVIAAIVHFLKTQMPGGFHLPPFPGLPRN